MLVSQAMSSPAVTVGPGDKVKDVAALLAERGFSAVPVVDPDGELLGIVSEADLLSMAEDGHGALPATAGQVMSRSAFAVDAGAPAARAADIMLQRGFRSLPVTAGDRVVGMVSRRDLVRALATVDSEIGAQVAGALAELARLLAAIQVEVSEGVVTLTGQLPAPARGLVEALATDLPGVRAVRLQPAPSGAG